jgi:hypothetical protein
MSIHRLEDTMPPHKSPLIISGKKRNQQQVIDNYFEKSLEKLSNVNVAEVQKVVASQLDIMSVYHYLVQEQAKKSFLWALIAGGIGLIFFIAAVSFILFTQIDNAAIISVVSGALIEVISGINFYLYSKTSSQLAEFQSRLDVTQRFLLANSVCEGLVGDTKNQARAKLVEAISSIGTNKAINVDTSQKS